MLKLVNAFNRLELPYVFVGAISVIIHGRIRTTLDIGVILDHRQIDSSNFVKILNELGFDVFENDLTGFNERMHVSMFFTKSMFRIDMKGVYDKKDEISINEAQTIEYQDTLMKIDHPVNLILNKLIFGSTQDLEDIVSVLTRYPELNDNPKLIKRCKEYNVYALLKELINKIDENIGS